MTDARVPARVTLLFVVTEDWYFVSHRLPLARAARNAGYRVIVASRFTRHRPLLESEGFEIRDIGLRRRESRVWREVLAIWELRRLYRENTPLIVHHVALKPVVFGSLAAVGLRGVRTVNAIAGLGFLFSSQSLSARTLRPFVTLTLRALLRHSGSLLIVQNDRDRSEVLRQRLARPGQIHLIRGAGVELDRFAVRPEPEGVPIAAFAGRLIQEKGVGEFVAAARILRSRDIPARFAVIGEPDDDNPGTVPRETLDAWSTEGIVELWGKREDMPAVLASVHIVCLPSTYGEGVPKILLEAAACGRPVVTTDWPGCRDAVEDRRTGILVPVGDQQALVRALEVLLTDSAKRRRFGSAARALAERNFDVRTVVRSTLEIYGGLSRELRARSGDGG
jgi:glycosyltransferase involved in cell wall biosynthesis